MLRLHSVAGNLISFANLGNFISFANLSTVDYHSNEHDTSSLLQTQRLSSSAAQSWQCHVQIKWTQSRSSLTRGYTKTYGSIFPELA